jgi:hypothetical protein
MMTVEITGCLTSRPSACVTAAPLGCERCGVVPGAVSGFPAPGDPAAFMLLRRVGEDSPDLWLGCGQRNSAMPSLLW